MGFSPAALPTCPPREVKEGDRLIGVDGIEVERCPAPGISRDFHSDFVQHVNFDQSDGYLEIDAFFINFDRNCMRNQ